MNGYYPRVVKLREAGFSFIRQGKGSHEVWSNGRITLIVPFNCKSRHTANAVLRDAGIKTRF
jgi:predicted RNA binding protein YcfA (HicA-like mRNA interferase family)